jgi:ELWxxDGT repeat protein
MTSNYMLRARGALLALIAAGTFAAGPAAAETAYQVTDLAGRTAGEQQTTADLVFNLGERVLEFGEFGSRIWSSDGTAAGTFRLPSPARAGGVVFNQLGLGTAARTVRLASPSGAGFVVSNQLGLAFYVAGTPESDQLWRSDGTRGGTFPLLGTGPGSPFGTLSSDPKSMTPFGGAVYFLSNSPAGSLQLWRTDGTLAHTTLVADTGNQALGQGQMVAAGGRLFFIAPNPDQQVVAVWVSDGTAAGTAEVRHFSGTINTLTAAGGRLFFVFKKNLELPAQMWTSDGTALGTQPVTAFAAGSAGYQLNLGNLTAVGERLYFPAEDTLHGEQMWVSDGTPAGTRPVTAFSTPHGNAFQAMTAVGNRLVFATSIFPQEAQIWASAGSLASTQALCAPGCAGFLGVLGSARVDQRSKQLMFWTAGDAGSFDFGTLWRTDGTPEGTFALTGKASPPVALGSAVFFPRRSARGVELWRSHGLPGGTRRFTERHLDLDHQNALGLRGRDVFFTGPDDDGVDQLWASDGSAAGTHQLTGVVRSNHVDIASLTSAGSQLFFTAAGQTWRSDGTVAGTTPLPVAGRILPGETPLLTVGGRLFTLQQDGALNLQLWTSDGSAAGTRQLTAITFPDVALPLLASYQGRAAFVVASPTGELAIWLSDGTLQGTVPAFPLPQGMSPLAPLVAVGQDLYFVASSSPDGGQAVWRLDGASGAAVQLTDRTSTIQDFTAVGGAGVVLFVETLGYGGELWRTDGTPGGTAPVGFHGVSDLVMVDGALYWFGVQPGDSQLGLWRSDGAASDPRLLARFPAEDTSNGSPFHGCTAFGGKLFFTADDGVSGRELWSTDGTPVGTRLVRDIVPGPVGSRPTGLTVAGGRLFFAADDGAHGKELWQSDGTAEGTRLVQDLAAGPASSSPFGMAQVGDLLVFIADNGQTDRELWALPLGGAGSGAGCTARATALCLQGSRFQVEAFWRDGSGATGHGQAVALSGDTGYFWFFSPGNVEVVTKVLDGRPLDGHFWVFYGALSNVEYWLTFTDTQTGAARTYYNPPGQLASVGDTTAFGPQGAFSAPPPRLPRAATGPPAAAPGAVQVGGASRAGDRAGSPGGAATRPDGASGAEACQAGGSRLCLNGSRFAVSVRWTDFAGRTGDGTAVALTGETGYFWFFDAANVELVVKVLDGRALNGKFWVFYGALSNVAYTVTVTDTVTGAVKRYSNASGELGSLADTGAF